MLGIGVRMRTLHDGILATAKRPMRMFNDAGKARKWLDSPAIRAHLEMWVFYLACLASFAHARLRPGRAWVEQCLAIATLALVAVALNWITTGDHPMRSLAHRHLWAVAGMDCLLLATGALAASAAHRLPGNRTLR